jgi:ATP-dependent DNA helicase RecQ
MRDQVKKLNGLGITARCINSEQAPEENTQIIEDAKNGRVKILYIAPERLQNKEFFEATSRMNLSMVVVDEAHCISVWGHDFRTAFRRIIKLIELLPRQLPVLATTATATKTTETDVAAQIGGKITVLRGNLMRENFNLNVIKVESEDEKLIWLGQNLDKLEGSGILYAGTRLDTEIYSKWFEFLKLSAIGYHAGLDKDTRIEIEEGWMQNRWKCVNATNALGMGMDKPDCRFIIHTQIPQSPIHYYQEIGRAGRDGKPAKIILFYNPIDKKLPEAFIDGSRPKIIKYNLVLAHLGQNMLGEKDLMRKCNLKQTPTKVILADLLEQGIIIKNSKDKYELKSNAPTLNPKPFEDLRNTKKKDLDKMMEYIDTTESRMKFLCDYLGDNSQQNFTNCDNTGIEKITVHVTDEWKLTLKNFRENYFPDLEVEGKGSKIVNGVAASFYGFSNVGAALRRCKYETNEDFPDFLLSLCLKAFRKKWGQERFDYIVYVPPTASGDLVKNFAMKLSHVLKFPIIHNLVKKRQTKEQKDLENGYLKSDNIFGAFSLNNPEKIKGKRVLLVDDIFDSGATIKELGKLFTKFGAVKIAPIVIAKTVGGDLA